MSISPFLAKVAVIPEPFVGVPGVGATEAEDTPYKMPVLLPTVIPDKLEDSFDKPPQFLVEAMRHRYGAHRTTLGEDARARPTSTKVAGVVNEEIDKHKPRIKKVPYTDKDEVDSPKPTTVKTKNGEEFKVGCGKRKGDIPCTDYNRDRQKLYPSNLPGAAKAIRTSKTREFNVNEPHVSVTPNGSPNQIMPSWEKNPSETLDTTPYGRPHDQWFKDEPSKSFLCTTEFFCCF